MAQYEISTGWKFVCLLFMFRSHGTTFTIVQPLKVPCEQSENIERSHVNEVSGQIFQPVKNSSGAVRVNITWLTPSKASLLTVIPTGSPRLPRSSRTPGELFLLILLLNFGAKF